MTCQLEQLEQMVEQMVEQHEGGSVAVLGQQVDMSWQLVGRLAVTSITQ